VLELKSVKEYLQSYRNLGIFQENIVNRVLEDVARWAKPVWAEVKGDFRPRGGISTVVIARWPRPRGKGHGRKARAASLVRRTMVRTSFPGNLALIAVDIDL